MLLICCSWILREYANATLQLSPSRSLRPALTLPDILRTALAQFTFTILLHFTSASDSTASMPVHDPSTPLFEGVRLAHLQVMQADDHTIHGVINTVGVVCEFVVGGIVLNGVGELQAMGVVSRTDPLSLNRQRHARLRTHKLVVKATIRVASRFGVHLAGKDTT